MDTVIKKMNKTSLSKIYEEHNIGSQLKKIFSGDIECLRQSIL